jgi:molecular chaperone GrpE
LANDLLSNFAQILADMSQENMTNNHEEATMPNDINSELNINADSDIPGDTHLNEPLGEDNELEKVQTELAEQKDKFLRLYAEFDNFKRRTAKENLELRDIAAKEVLLNMLDVLDDMDRSQLQLAQTEDVVQIKDGVQLVYNKFRNIMATKGIKVMETKGEAFNADLHEAITEIPAPTEELKGKIIDEVTKGYYLNSKIIRFAKVVVGN